MLFYSCEISRGIDTREKRRTHGSIIHVVKTIIIGCSTFFYNVGCSGCLAAAIRFYLLTPNLYMVFCVYCPPGFSTTDGKYGWFGESGKCCASKQMALLRGNVAPCCPL